MRRANLGNGQGYGAQLFEEENERLEEELSDKVKALKSLSIDMGTEVREQNTFLREMDSDFDKSGNILSASMGRLKEIAKKGGPRFICYILMFACFVFFICWLIVKFR